MQQGQGSERTRERARRFDLVLWGATGFTGQLVAEYLIEHYGDTDLRWAMAGRSLEKLEGVRESLRARHPRAATLPLLRGDSFDRDSLDAIAADAEVVCSTVGPYAQYGDDLVAACVEHRTDYCDLTGESHWVQRMVDAHHDQAALSGARIVHCCGFDSIPSDLGVLMLQDYMAREHGSRCEDIRFYLRRSKGAASGGTIASMVNMIEEATRDPAVRRALADPYALNPEGQRAGPDRQDLRGVRFDERLGGWTAPFIMAAINTRVVRRSHALRGTPHPFRYSETTAFPAGPRGLIMASALAAGLGLFTAAMLLPPTRRLLNRFVLPAPGQGPSPQQIEDGFFNIGLIGRGPDAKGRPIDIEGTVRGVRDPGYGETAKMLAEAALCLALDGADLDAPHGGVLTPSTAMGMTLVKRLRDAGMTFDVQERSTP